MMLSIKNISKSFIQRGSVLKDLCLDVNQGDSIAITGPSGSGKTTLLNIIGLLDKPDSGLISFRGESIANFSEDDSADYRSKNIGFVFQEHHLLPHLTVSENIHLPLLAVNYKPEQLKERELIIKEMLDKTLIFNLSKKYPENISGGEAQRVAVVRALVNSPSLLLADEPTGSLDSKNAVALGDLLLALNKETGITIILATHSDELAARMSRRMRLEDGKLIEVN